MVEPFTIIIYLVHSVRFLNLCRCLPQMFHVSFLIIDPGTRKSPAWEVTPDRVETAVEGRNKTLYCLAVGR